MITEQEQERLQMIQGSIGDIAEMVKEAMGEEALPEGGIEMVLGTLLATVDALFAIREGEAWRGVIDPREIARNLLREAHLGEVES